MAATPLPIDRDEDDTSGGTGRMGFLDHLDELRQRLIRSCVAIGAGMLVAFFFVDRIGDFILAPTLKALPAGDALIFTRPGEGFAFYLDVSFIGGILLAAPFVMYEVWQFIAPGLYTREKRFAVPFIALTTIGSIGGALFTHYIMFPGTIAFLAQFHSPAMKFVPRVEDTFDMYLSMMLGMVAVFQIPTLVFFLAKLRLVTAGFLWRHFKYAILVSFIVAAVLTPSADPWNQTIFAAPMIALYVLSIGIAWLVAPRTATRGRRGDSRSEGTGLRLVIGAMVIDQARKSRRRTTC
ncbi:MAG TPA: twin-arginine translocase subunit TatC [Vicinamibacterales bacterium]|jgi:sec-independent protein translocase protein TatC